jgi:hypothetical protein
MAECVACHQPLVVEIEFSDDEDVEMAESSASKSGKQTYPDDVHLVSRPFAILINDALRSSKVIIGIRADDEMDSHTA